MKHTTGAIAVAAIVASMAGYFAPAMADGYYWHHRERASKARPYARQFYRSSPRNYNSGAIRYYNTACPYGDCECLRGVAVRTGSQVWWDRYQACSG